jgi:hypothetical protein
MSTIIAKVQVDETDVVRLAKGDSVQVAIDAFPDTTFVGRVSKVSNSAKLTPHVDSSGSTDKAVDFDVEVTLVAPPERHPTGPSCTARIVTDTRDEALSIPIIALTVREHEDLPLEDTNAHATPASQSHDAEGGQPPGPLGKKKKDARACSWCATASRRSGRSRWAWRATSISRCSTACAAARPSWPAPTRPSATSRTARR